MLLYQKLKETTEISEQKDRQLRIQKMKVDDLSYQMSETGDRIARLEKVNSYLCKYNSSYLIIKLTAALVQQSVSINLY
jgi:hypothetical protein